MQNETDFPDVEVSTDEGDGSQGIGIYTSITDGSKVVTSNSLLLDPEATPEEIAEQLLTTVKAAAAMYGTDTWIALQHRLSS